VTFETADGLELHGWYIPSRNGAAVISFPGRKGPQQPARILAEHGYGVLLFDRRGEGESEGDPNSWGWGGEADIAAAAAYLRTRPDVDPGRIGGIGLSVGGEMMIEAAAETDDLAAVVSEGAGARSVREDLDRDEPLLDRTLGLAMSAARTLSTAVSANQAPPESLTDLAAEVDEPLLLIAAPVHGVGEQLNRGYHAAAGANSTLWEIPESTHVGGLEARPEEYERRVVGFFDEALR
jgi:dienelactone hydrolase